MTVRNLKGRRVGYYSDVVASIGEWDATHIDLSRLVDHFSNHAAGIGDSWLAKNF